MGDRTSRQIDFLQNFDFDNCKVATYILKQNPNLRPNKVNFKNGSLTELGKHAISCDYCKGIKDIIKDPYEGWTLIPIDNIILRKLHEWQKKNAPYSKEDQAIELLIKYFEFAKKELKGKL